MARISVDINQISKNLREHAEKARVQITDLAKKVEKDLGHNETVKKLVDHGLKLAVRAGETAEELRKEFEKRTGKDPVKLVDTVRAKVTATAKEVRKTVAAKRKPIAKKAKKSSAQAEKSDA